MRPHPQGDGTCRQPCLSLKHVNHICRRIPEGGFGRIQRGCQEFVMVSYAQAQEHVSGLDTPMPNPPRAFLAVSDRTCTRAVMINPESLGIQGLGSRLIALFSRNMSFSFVLDGPLWAPVPVSLKCTYSSMISASKLVTKSSFARASYLRCCPWVG